MTQPALPARFLAPKGLIWERFLSDGASLRAAFVPAVGAPRGNCIVVGGFSECAEKYFETLSEASNQALDVWFLDWRGQGGSDRPPTQPTRPTARDFDQDAGDLLAFTSAKVTLGRPCILIAHSMGGAIALLALAALPGMFDAAVLSAPMLGIATGGLPTEIARWTARAAVAFGAATAFAPGFGPWAPNPEISTRNPATRDPMRATIQQEWFQANADLRLDGPTYGWVNSAFQVTQHLARPEMLKCITTPLLIGNPGVDAFVLPAATRRAAALLPRARLLEFGAARHELFLERDEIRSAWMSAIAAFLEPILRAAPGARVAI